MCFVKATGSWPSAPSGSFTTRKLFRRLLFSLSSAWDSNLHSHLDSVKRGAVITNEVLGVTHEPLGLPSRSQNLSMSLCISPKSVCNKSILAIRVVLQP